ncbi:MAG: hypothetical protein NTZ85_02255 [Bacteroidia bacterium]|nr:hypothetical protein [Bacteroidia bacterium]
MTQLFQDDIKVYDVIGCPFYNEHLFHFYSEFDHLEASKKAVAIQKNN